MEVRWEGMSRRRCQAGGRGETRGAGGRCARKGEQKVASVPAGERAGCRSRDRGKPLAPADARRDGLRRPARPRVTRPSDPPSRPEPTTAPKRPRTGGRVSADGAPRFLRPPRPARRRAATELATCGRVPLCPPARGAPRPGFKNTQGRRVACPAIVLAGRRVSRRPWRGGRGGWEALSGKKKRPRLVPPMEAPAAVPAPARGPIGPMSPT
jgi:hypothetical protein